MTQEDIIRMAREADLKANLSEPYCLDHKTRAWLERFAALVAAAEQKKWEDQTAIEIHEAILDEREECAMVCEARARDDGVSNHRRVDAAILAERIRAKDKNS